MNFDKEDERRVAAALAAGADVRCPRCATPMAVRRIPPSDRVSYVRRRTWLACGPCGRSLVLDDRDRRAVDASDGKA